jgi:hypothetical protein
MNMNVYNTIILKIYELKLKQNSAPTLLLSIRESTNII